MIKVKIHNPKEDRNEPTFRVMLMMTPYFRGWYRFYNIK